MKLEFNELSDYYDDNSTQEVDSMKNNEFSVGDIVVYDDRVYIVVRAPEDELAYLSYDVLDCGVRTDDKEWYKIKVRYVTDDEFWYADRRRRRFLYSD